MAAIGTLKLSDGTDTIDFHSANYRVLRNGVNIPPPVLDSKFISSQFVDGDRLANARYGNRTIDIKFLVIGSDLEDLRTNVRAIQRLLNDARYRNLIGQGAQVYLEYQWGTTVGESVYFDVNFGELILPGDFSSPHLWRNNLISSCTLSLNCKPFGRYTNQDIAQATLENNQHTQCYYQGSYNAASTTNFTGDIWIAQTFTTIASETIVGAALQGYRAGTLTTMHCELYATAAGKPTGAALASGTLDVSAWDQGTNTDAMAFAYIEFGTPYTLSATTMYALVWYIDDIAPNSFYFRYQANTGSFANGTRLGSPDAGANWGILANDDLVFAVIVQDTGYANYQDIATLEAYGDRQAKTYWKIAATGAAGSKKTWLAKRSGIRYDDNLWINGYDYSSFIDVAGIGGTNSWGWEPSDVYGGVQAYKGLFNAIAPADTDVGYFSYNISPIPQGNFKVLAKCQVECQDAADYDHLSFGFGWSYGDRNYTPTEAKGEYHECAADSAWEILDLGLISLPPVAQSEIATDNTFVLNIWTHVKTALTAAEYYLYRIAYIFLLPIDEGAVIIDACAAADLIAMDGISEPTGVFILSAGGLIEDYPDYVGNPFSIGREITRFYILRDDGYAVTFASDVKYQPLFLVI